MGHILLKFFILVNVINLTLQEPRAAQIHIVSGNLEFTVGDGKNVTFQTSGGGTVVINDIDILKIAKTGGSLSSEMTLLKNLMKTTNSKTFSLQNTLTGKYGVIERLTMIENGIGQGNVSTDTLLGLQRSYIRLNYRIMHIQRRISRLFRTLRKNECESNPCKNGGTCQDMFNAFTCLCPSEWEGETCEKDSNECVKFAGTDLGCQNGATCINTYGGYECQCMSGFYGIHCTKRSLDCNSGTTEICGHGFCINQKNGVKCICDQGWTTDGTNPACQVDVNECTLNHPPCSVNPPVSCINVPGSFYCGSCPQGYSGNGYYCADINECAISNGGCSTNPMVQCTNTPGSRICGLCPPGYTGNGETCTYQGNICESNNGGCHPSATCKVNPHISATFVTCTCPNGYSGTGIGPNGCSFSNNTSSDVCNPNPCLHGTCYTSPFGYYCICNRNYTGRNCNQARKSPCEVNPCENGGTCVPTTYYYYCNCPSTFRGRHCEAESQGCGGTIKGDSGILVYPSSNSTTNQKYIVCGWLLDTNATRVINVTFTRFLLENQIGCNSNWLQIHDGMFTGTTQIGRFCGNKLPLNGTIVSSANYLYIWLRMTDAKRNNGFALTWRSQKPICEEFINVTSHGTISSPGSPKKYPNNRDCLWVLTAPLYKRIVFHFFALEIGKNANCNADYLEFKQTQPPYDIFAKYCNSSQPQPLTSPDSSVTIHFHSDAYGAYQGFQISYSLVSGIPGCGGIFTKNTGQIRSPVINKIYPPNTLCEYKIQLNSASRVKLTFVSFNLAKSLTCQNDYLAVYGGDSSEARFIGKYCGNKIPAPIISNDNLLFIEFKTDWNGPAFDFELEYETICGAQFTDPSGTITPSVYSDKCIYEIAQPAGSIISINMLPLDTWENTTKVNNICEVIEIRDGDNTNSTLFSNFCSNPMDTIVSSFNHLLIIYKNYEGRDRIFNYTSIDVGCGGILKEPRSTISSSHYNVPAKIQMTCNWVISAPLGNIIQLSWLQFHVEDSHKCMYDYVKVFDNNTIENFGGLIGTYCGSTSPPTITSTSNILTIRYITDESITLDGITFSYVFLQEDKVCGGNYHSNMGVIRSPNYPNNYPLHRQCIWYITAKPGQQIRLNITNFDLEYSYKCTYDYLEIRSGGTATSPLLGTFCGSQIPKIIPAHSNKIYLNFKSDLTKSGKGFEIFWDGTTTGCGGILSSARGSVISPNYPEPYDANGRCEWKITASAGSKIKIIIADMDLEHHEVCSLDYVEFFDGMDARAKNLGRFCSANSYPHIIQTNSSAMLINYKSDTSVQGRGFNLQYLTMCNNTLTGYRGVIENINFPNSFIENQNCNWEILVSKGNKINITFSHYDFKMRPIMPGGDSRFSNDKCVYFHLEILYFQHDSETWVPKAIYCDYTMPAPLTIESNHAKIEFKAKASYVRGSFRLEWINFGCGGRLTHPEGNITSPNYPNAYPDDVVCEWIIVTEYGKSIEITFHTLDMEKSSDCYYDSLKIYNGPDDTYPSIGTYCTTIHKPVVLTGTGSEMYMIFMSDSAYKARGFLATYKSVNSKCGGKFSTNTGSIHSPNYPNNFDDYSFCDWSIEVEENYLIQFNVTNIDFRESPNCISNYLKIYDGPTAAYPVLAKLCNATKLIVSTRNSLFIEMRTTLAAKGFRADYKLACGRRIETEGTGILTFTPDHSNEEEACTFTIVSTNLAQHVHLTFTHLSAPYYCYDNSTDVVVYDGEDSTGPVLGQYCGIKVPPKITSKGSAIHIAASYNNIFSLSYSVFDSTCGGTYESLEGFFASPNYPNNYPGATDCEWTIKITPGNKVTLSFSDFHLTDSPYCNEDYLEIREETNTGKLLGSYCGDVAPTNLTIANSLWIFFRSDTRGKGETTATGFMAEYKYNSGSEITGTSGQIASPLYPRFYAETETIRWQISVRPGNKILITFKEFYIDRSTEYCVVHLNVYDGPDVNHPTLFALCGHELPKPIESSSNFMLIELDSQISGINGRFLLDWKEIEKIPGRVQLKPLTSNACGEPKRIDLSDIHVANITSPGYPFGYAPRLFCEWIFSTTPGKHLQISFTDISLESVTISTYCFSDAISVYTGIDGTESWKLLKSVCLSNETERTDLISSNYMKVIFRTDMYVNRTGFAGVVFEVCGGVLEDSNGVITVDNFTTIPDNYIDYESFECQWNITVKSGRTIEFKFLEFKFGYQESTSCDQYILLKNGQYADSPILGDGKYCGTKTPPVLTTTGKHAYIKFYGRRKNLKTFKLQYREISTLCGGQIVLSNDYNSTNISSPNYPNIPNPNTECTWIILAPTGEKISVDFIDRFDLTKSDDCNAEYVEARDGAVRFAPLLGKYCESKPGTVSSTDNSLYLHFFTNVEDPRNGFKAVVSIAKCGGTIRGSYGTITSPNLGNRALYPTGTICSWFIIGPHDHSLSLTFNNPEPKIVSDCRFDFVLISYERQAPGLNDSEKFCFHQKYRNVTAPSNKVFVKFLSGGTNYQFSISFNASQDACGGTLETASGVIQSPGYPVMNHNNRDCEWVIKVPKGRRITFTVFDLDLDESYPYNEQGLAFFNGVGILSMASQFGNTNDTVIKSSSYVATVFFWSTHVSSHRGFKVTYTSDEPTICQGDFNKASGVITQPMSNEKSFYCLWERNLNRYNNQTVALSIVTRFFKTEATTQCTRSAFISVTTDKERDDIATLCATTKYPRIVRSPYPITKIIAIVGRHWTIFNFTINYDTHPCGGLVSTSQGSLTNPNYPNKYGKNVDCAWLIQLPEEQRINITTELMDIGDDCTKNYITIYNGKSPKSPLIGTFCNTKSIAFTSPTNALWIDYHGDKDTNGKGFKLNYEPYVTVCQSLTGAKTLQSPFFPDRYPNNIECVWDITVMEGLHIGFIFDRFQLEESHNCENDSLKIFDYANADWKLIGNICGKNIPSYLNSTSNKMRIVFKTNNAVTGLGFKAHWVTNCGGTFTADDTKRYIFSPGYPNDYSNDLFCIYNITTPKGHIMMSFEDFSLEDDDGCNYDMLSISVPFLGSSPNKPKIYCGTTSPPPIINSNIQIKFKTDHWVTRTGFKLSYVIDVCGEEINGVEKRISSPIFSNPADGKELYMNSINCTWNITAPPNKNVVVRFTVFQLSHQYHCAFDFVALYNGNALNDTSRLAVLCGNLTNNLPIIQSKGNSMLIHMETDRRNNNNFRGFEAYILYTYGANVGCGGKIDVSSTFTLQPPMGYSFLDCHWVLFAPQDHVLKIELQQFTLSACPSPSNSTCPCHMLQINDAASSLGETISTLCTTITEKKIFTTSSRYGFVRFATQSKIDNQNTFRMELTAIPALCGDQNLYVSKDVGYITSPNYPNVYPDNIKCVWYLKSFGKIYIKFVEFDLNNSNNLATCTGDRLEIETDIYKRFTENSLGPQTIFRGSNHHDDRPYVRSSFPIGRYQFCGNLTDSFDYYSWGQRVIVSFYSQENTHGKGFKLLYTKAGCSQNYTDVQGRVMDKGFMEPCYITITVPENLTISIYFATFYVFDTASCNTTGLEITDLKSSRSLARLCGYSVPNPVFSLSNSISIRLWNNKKYSMNSYDFIYTTTSEGRGCGGAIYNYYGRFTSPLYPANYTKDSVCVWEIKVPQGLQAALAFTVFNLRGDCEIDYVTVITYDGDNTNEHRICENNLPGTYRSNNRITVKYVTSTANFGGWIASFQGVTETSKLNW